MAHCDFIFCALYKYSYLLTCLLTYLYVIFCVNCFVSQSDSELATFCVRYVDDRIINSHDEVRADDDVTDDDDDVTADDDEVTADDDGATSAAFSHVLTGVHC